MEDAMRLNFLVALLVMGIASLGLAACAATPAPATATQVPETLPTTVPDTEVPPTAASTIAPATPTAGVEGTGGTLTFIDSYAEW
jgi:hypothetical protein